MIDNVYSPRSDVLKIALALSSDDKVNLKGLNTDDRKKVMEIMSNKDDLLYQGPSLDKTGTHTKITKDQAQRILKTLSGETQKSSSNVVISAAKKVFSKLRITVGDLERKNTEFKYAIDAKKDQIIKSLQKALAEENISIINTLIDAVIFSKEDPNSQKMEMDKLFNFVADVLDEDLMKFSVLKNIEGTQYPKEFEKIKERVVGITVMPKDRDTNSILSTQELVLFHLSEYLKR